MYYTHLVVNDRGVSRGQWDGGDTANELSHLLSALHFSIAREGPQNGVDEIARDILL